jgi:DNA replication and repair protein RecF
MNIGKIRLQDFRNFKSKILEFSDATTVIVGPNASGKTNILESLFLLSTGRSSKARIEEEMISYDKEIARVKGKTESGVLLEVVLTRGLIDVGNGHPERVARKKLYVNGVAKRLIDFAGNFKVVLFGPQDLDLVTESPSLRRKFLDGALSQIDREYRRSILSYDKGLRQRNRLLWRIREEGINRSQLLFWNQLLIRNGDYISNKREEFIDYVNNRPSLQNTRYQLTYDKSVISEGRLDQYKEEEAAAATTLVGPHRDDFVFKILNAKKANTKFQTRELAIYGSRGEQRMGVLWLKMAELDYIGKCFALDSTPSVDLSSLTIRRSLDYRPTLLLDDIFSELDREHRDIVMEITDKQQTIITTADPHFVKNLKKVEKIEIAR